MVQLAATPDTKKDGGSIKLEPASDGLADAITVTDDDCGAKCKCKCKCECAQVLDGLAGMMEG